MKILKTFVLLLLFVPLFFSCDEDREPVNPTPSQIVPGINIFGTFDLVPNSKVEEVNEHYVEISFNLDGLGTMNLLGSSSIQLQYDKFIEISNDSSTINRGSFIIKAESGEEISGGFGGHLKSNDAGTEEYVNAYITDGTHQYKDCKGDFTLKFKSDKYQNRVAEINGKIFLNEISQPQ